MAEAIKLASIKGKIDFVIVTIREDEFKSVLRQFSPHYPVYDGKQIYEYHLLQKPDGSSFSVAIVRTFDQGQSIAQSVTRDAIEDLSPQWIILTGIAGGVPDGEFTLGDVLLASSIHDLSITAAVEGRGPEFRPAGGPAHASVERLLANLPAREQDLGNWSDPAGVGNAKPKMTVPDDISDKCYYGDDATRGDVRDLLQGHFPASSEARNPRFKIGAVASSNVLLKDTKLLAEWRRAARHISHIEMEAGGAYLAARQARPHEIPLLCVRGISDVVGFKRSGDWTQFACDVAAAFLVALLKTLPAEAFDFTNRVPPEPLGPILEASTSPSISDIIQAFGKSSAPLVSLVVDTQDRIPRPEKDELLDRSAKDSGEAVCVLGGPGSGKTALLALLAQEASQQAIPTLAIKADLLPKESPFDGWGQSELGIDISALDAVKVVASRGRVLVIVDQLDALSNIVAVSSDLFNSVVGFITECVAIPNVTVVCSCRELDYYHDARFRELGAEVVELSLPPWEEVAKQLTRHGLTDTENWPDAFREILRTPQHLKIYLDRYEKTGGTDSFSSYQLMLDDLWTRNVKDQAEREFLYSFAEYLMNNEALWAPAVAFEEHASVIDSLKAKEILQAQGPKIGFKHQTQLEHAKARLFTKSDKSFAEYVVANQDSLVVRPTVWAVLQYLRDAHPDKYKTELEGLFASNLRLHLNYLLIDFVGNIPSPDEFEVMLLGSRLADLEYRVRVLLSIRGRQNWFVALRKSHFPEVMTGEIQHQWPMIQVIIAAWDFAHDECFELITKYWFTDPLKDRLTERALREIDYWDDKAIEMVIALVRRTADQGDRLFWAEQMVYTISMSRPEKAPQVFIEVLLKLAENPIDEGKPRPRSLLKSHNSWYDLPAVAEADPIAFLKAGWGWLVATCEAHHAGPESSVINHYGGLGLSLDDEEYRHETPVLASFLIAIDETAKRSPETFLEITTPTWNSKNEYVHRLIARGLCSAVSSNNAEIVVSYLVGDPRRLLLGGHSTLEQGDSIALIEKLSPLLDSEHSVKLEQYVLSWSQYRQGQKTYDRHDTCDRESRLRLLNALDPALVTEYVTKFVEAEKTQLPGWNRVPNPVRAGFVHEIPPITKRQMEQTTEDEIADVIMQTPDLPRAERSWNEVNGGWETAGGPTAAGRELAQLAKEHPQKVVDVIRRFVERGGEAAASSAFEGLSDSKLSHDDVLQFAADLIAIDPQSSELRHKIAYLLYKRCDKPDGLSDDLCKTIRGWLRDDLSVADSETPDDELKDLEDDGNSVLWRHTGGAFHVDNSFWLLLTATEGYLSRIPPDTDQWLEMLEGLLNDKLPVNAWKHYLSNLRDIRLDGVDKNRGIKLIGAIYASMPELLETTEGVLLIANIADLFPEAELRTRLDLLRQSAAPVIRQAYGELITLIAFRDEEHVWASDLLESEMAACEDADRIDESIAMGIAHAAANLWDEPRARKDSAAILCRLVPVATDKIGHAIAGVFWAKEDFAVSDETEQLFQQLATNPEKLPNIPINDLVPHMVGILPHKRHVVLSLCQAILTSRTQEDDLFEVGPQLVSIAMTLQRFADTRADALSLFEQLLKRGLDDAFRALQHVDIRPPALPIRAPRERRRRRRR
jgi:nucleoside phosphorylase